MQVRCPRCQGLLVLPPHLAGSAQTCSYCRLVFTVPPLPHATGNVAMPATPAPLAGPLPPHLRSLSTQPPVAAASSPDAEESPRPSRWIGIVMRVSLLAIAASLIIALMLIPKAVKTWQKAQAEQKLKQVEPPPPDVVEVIDLRPKDGGPIQWIDAVRSAGLRAGMHVRVTRCEYGEVLARDANNQPIAAGPGEFLQIHLRITNRLKSKARYISWYGHQFADGSEQVAAKLVDTTGREYPPQRWSGLKSIASHVEEATLEPGESVGDVLIFALPAAKGTGGEELRLQLPGGAVARTGWFNFKLTSELWER
jgi:hypothetical protein